MQADHAFIITMEKCQQVLRQIILVSFSKAADDGAIQCDVFGVNRIGGIDQDIAGMHIGVEKVVFKNLLEERFYTLVSQYFEVHATRFEFINLVDGNAINPFHNQQLLAGMFGVHAGT